MTRRVPRVSGGRKDAIGPGGQVVQPRARVRSERGSGSVLMIGVIAVLLVLSGATMVVAGYVVAGHRAKAAADLGALSGAAAVRSGRDACQVAADVARRQRAAVRRCERVGDQIDFAVTVTAEVRVGIRVPGLPRTVSSTAHAGPVQKRR